MAIGSIAIRKNKKLKAKVINPNTGKPDWLFVYPYTRPSHSVGAAMTLKDKDYSVQLNPSIQQTLSLMGALWLESIGQHQPAPLDDTFSSLTEEITPRQTQVLALVSQGSTNQDTVKICRT